MKTSKKTFLISFFIEEIAKIIQKNQSRCTLGFLRSLGIASVLCTFFSAGAGQPEVISFYPAPAGSCHGIYFPGGKVEMILAVRNHGKKMLNSNVKFVCKDFFDREAVKISKHKLTAAPGETGIVRLTFTAPERFGHFTVNAAFDALEMQNVKAQSAFAVLDKRDRRDPFFALDNGYFNFDLLDGYARYGVGTLELLTQMWYTSGSSDVEPLFRKPQMQKVMQSDFNLIFDFPVRAKEFRKNASAPDLDKRLRQGLLPFTDKDIEHARKYAEAVGRMTGGRITYYQISQEYDVNVLRPNNFGDTTSVLSEYVQMGRAIADGVKKGNPEAKVAVLGTMGIDYFRRKPTFPLSRILLDGLGSSRWDLVMIHAYSNGRVGEDRKIKSSASMGLREFLLASSQLAVSYGKSPLVINGERGAACYYDDPFDSDNCRSVACDTAQSLIVSKSTPCLFYCAHFGVNPHNGLRAVNPKVRAAMNKVTDYSFMWKSVTDESQKQPRLVPRPGGAAYATVSRELAFCTFSRELRFGYLHCYTFSKKDGSSIAAMWSDGRETVLELDLPDGSRLTDIMGVSEKLSGKQKITINDYPVFLTLPVPVQNMDKLISGAKSSNANPVEGAGRRLDRYYAGIFLRNLDSRPLTGILTVPGGPKTERFTLAPMKQRYLNMPLPRSCRGNTTAHFITDDGRTFKIPFNADYITIPRIKDNAPSLKGKIREWKPFFAGTLRVPDNVWPRSALMQEYNLFKKDGSDINADYYFAADDRYFYMAVDVKDKTHYQPAEADKRALSFDSVQFCFSRTQMPPHSMRPAAADLFRAGDYHFGMALTGKGAKVFHLSSGPDRESGIRNYPVNITRDADHTFYEVAIPWADIKLRRIGGGGFRFSFAVSDKNGAQDNLNRYLVLSPGMTVLQDSAEFPTLVNAE